MANLSNINDKFLVTTGGNVLIGQTSAVGSSILQVTGNSTFLGNVGIGISPNQNLHIFKSDATALIQASNTSGVAQLEFFPRDASNVAHKQSIKGVDSNLTFLTGGNSGNSYVPTERMRITSAGDILCTSDGGSDAFRVFNPGTGAGDIYLRVEKAYTSAAVGRAAGIILGSNAGNLGSTWTMEATSQLGYFSGADLAFTHNSGGTASRRVTFKDGGNVGIGTASPQGKVDIQYDMDVDTGSVTGLTAGRFQYGNINFSGVATQTTGAAGTTMQGITWQVNNYLGSVDYGNQAQLVVGSNGNVGTFMGFFTSGNYSAAPVEAIRIDSAQNVGIGTNSPGSYKLNVAGAMNVEASASAAWLSVINNSAINGHGLLITAGGTTGTRYITQWKDYAGTERFHMEDNGEAYFQGNVGIGNASPRDKLTVFTSGSAEEQIALRLVNPVGFTNAGSGASLIFAQDRSTAENYPMAKIRSTQGIAGTSGYGNLALSTSSAGTMSDKMTIESGGDVGIGTTNPRAKLEVAGDITIQNGVYTYKAGGGTAGSIAINVDIPVGNEGGAGNVFKIEAGFAHYHGMTYNSIGEWWCTTRGTNSVNTYILNAGTAFAGTWSSSKPTTTTLRVTKSAGTYGGGGKWWVKVTYVPF